MKLFQILNFLFRFSDIKLIPALYTVINEPPHGAHNIKFSIYITFRHISFYTILPIFFMEKVFILKEKIV